MEASRGVIESIKKLSVRDSVKALMSMGEARKRVFMTVGYVRSQNNPQNVSLTAPHPSGISGVAKGFHQRGWVDCFNANHQ